MSVDPMLDQIERESPLRRGLTVWFAVFGGLGAWTVHLLALTSLTQWTVDSHRGQWPLDAITGVCVAVTLVAFALSWRLWRAGRSGDDEADDPAGRIRFLGFSGLVFNAINLALILTEGLAVPVLYPGHR
jgi:hypothetical protein